MNSAMLKILVGLLGVVMGVVGFVFQFLTLVFVHLNRSSLDSKDYTFEFIAQIFTLMVCVWFTGIQLRRLAKHARISDL